MGKIALQIKATLTNIDKLIIPDPEHFAWPLKVRCTGCGEESPNWHIISKDEEVELSNSKVNFLYKCKCCSRENTLSIAENVKVNPKQKTAKNPAFISSEYTSEDDGQFKSIVAFDCRGLELTAFEFRDGWAAESGKKKFTEVDFSEGEWCEYNDLDDVPVEISGPEHQFVAIK